MEDSELKQAINDYGGMQPPHFAFYLESIRYHCDSAMNSIDAVARFIEESIDSSFIDPNAEVVILDHIQNIVTHAASISKYFWPISDGKHKLHKKRGQTLRAHFNLLETSALKDKSLRNHIE